MTKTNIIWAAGVSLAGAYFGVSVMLGNIPGAESGVGTFERIAGLIAMGVERYGQFLTGLGVIVSGLVVGGLCLIGGKGSPDAGTGID